MRLARGLLLGLCLAWSAQARGGTDWSEYVLKVETLLDSGGQEMGSAVPLAGGRMITNCHVVRQAREISVSNRRGRWRARLADSDAYRDLCQLEVPGYQGPVAPVADAGEARVGMRVLAVGYSHGRLGAGEGVVKGLHTCPCDGGRVIQTSAPFDRGASGGGLFDETGRLVGILTFKARTGGDFHFALPVGWLRGLARGGLQSITGGHPFWQASGKDSAYFLTACALDADRNWPQLHTVAREWTRQETDNPESWMALGRACRGLARLDDAIEAFRRALRLDSTHTEAWWELQKLEFDLGRPLMEEQAS